MIAALQHIGQRAYSSTETLAATYEMAVSCIERGIPGDFVECGVAAGAQVAAMAKALEERGEARRIHLFDSFCGIPRGGPHDNDIRELVGFSEVLESSGATACSEDQVRAHMAEWNVPDHLLVYHPGWFQETAPQWSGPIALLRLDGDLYESTKVCMEHLVPHVSKGGWIIVDDFALDGCRKAVLEAMKPGPIYFHAQ
jgi:O-methyltransferase